MTYKPRSFGPTPARIDELAKIPVEHLAEAVDVAFVEFMTALHECTARAGLDPAVSFGWLLAQMADANYHWATALGKFGYVNFRTNPHVGATFADIVEKFGKKADDQST